MLDEEGPVCGAMPTFSRRVALVVAGLPFAFPL
jgi:hypothetical protein